MELYTYFCSNPPPVLSVGSPDAGTGWRTLQYEKRACKRKYSARGAFVKYVCVYWVGKLFTVGKIYELTSEGMVCNTGEPLEEVNLVTHTYCFRLATPLEELL